MPVLAILIALPLVGALIVGLLPSRRQELVYPVSVALSLLTCHMYSYPCMVILDIF